MTALERLVKLAQSNAGSAKAGLLLHSCCSATIPIRQLLQQWLLPHCWLWWVWLVLQRSCKQVRVIV